MKRDSAMRERIEIRVTREEKERIHKRMESMGIRSMSAYVRKMALDGYCVRLDLGAMRETVRLLSYSSKNLNQYTKLAHESGSIYGADIEDLRERLNEIYGSAKDMMAKLAKL